MKNFPKQKYFWISLGLFILVILLTGGSDKKDQEFQDLQQRIVESENISNIDKVIPETEDPSASAGAESVQVIQVVDGDTLKININGREETIRVIGINTPETVDPRKPVECFGKEASDKAKEILTGKNVTLEIDNSQDNIDKYGRLLRYITLSDRSDYGKYMIENGYAYEYTYEIPYQKQSVYKSAQAEAKSEQVGLWSPGACGGSKSQTETTITTMPVSTSPESSSEGYYTSSYGSTKYYSPASCKEWEKLSPDYRKYFNTLQELLNAYPSRTLNPKC